MKPKLRLVKKSKHISKLKVWRDNYLGNKHVKLESKTLRNYENVINLYINFVGDNHWPPTYYDLLRFLDDVRERASQITAYTYWSILRAWFNYLAKLGLFDGIKNPAQEIQLLDLAPKNPTTMPKGIPTEHVDAVLKYLQSLPSSLNNLRDMTLVHFLYRTGVRAGEASTLTEHTLYLESNKIYFDADNVKDDEDREIFFGEKVKANLRKWLLMLSDSGYDGIWVFPSTRRGQIVDKPLSVGGIYQMFRRRLKQTGLPMYCVHDLRHTFTKTAIQKKISLSSIQRQLGHTYPDMVLRYAKAFSQDQERDFSDFGDDE